MNIPVNLKYTKEHLWLDIDGNSAVVGITDYAQEEMGDILFVDLPEPGDTFSAGDTFSELESSKTTQELNLPFDFEISAVNEELDDSPENINEDAYKNWIVKITFGEVSGLLSCEEYSDAITE